MCFEYFELQQGKMFQVVGRLRQKKIQATKVPENFNASSLVFLA
jgi:hypothetical protein